MTHGVLGLVGAVCGFSLCNILLPPLLLGSFCFFSFFFLSFFPLGTGFFAFPALPSEEEGSEEDLDEVEALGTTCGSFS